MRYTGARSGPASCFRNAASEVGMRTFYAALPFPPSPAGGRGRGGGHACADASQACPHPTLSRKRERGKTRERARLFVLGVRDRFEPTQDRLRHVALQLLREQIH